MVRHGETEANVAGIAQGRRPYSLTERGRAQAHAAARLIARIGWAPTVTVTSPVVRCVETADIVTDHLGVPDPVRDDAFTEIDPGEAEGRAYSDLSAADGFERFGGESDTDLFARVGNGLDALPRDETILMVTHGGVFKAILRHLMSLHGPYWLGLRCGTCMRLERKRDRFAFTHFLHPEEVE